MTSFRETVEHELEKIDDLPTLPSVLVSLDKALLAEDTSAADVGRIITDDPSLTSRILRVANSAYYGASAGPITSVTNAVARIGFRDVRDLVTSFAVIETFNGVGTHLDHRAFWKHCLGTGIAARVIQRHSGHDGPFDEDEAYLSGLLHDVGTLILDQFFPEVFIQVRQIAEERGLPCSETEQKLLKIDHGEIGGWLLRRWNLPAAVVEAVTWHHQPAKATPECQPLVEVTHLADFICTDLGIGDGSDGLTRGFKDAAWHNLALEIEDIPAIIDQVLEEAGRCDSLLSFGG